MFTLLDGKCLGHCSEGVSVRVNNDLYTKVDEIRIIEVKVPHQSSVSGESIKAINWPKSCVIVALLHKFEAQVPGADEKILAGDSLVAIIAKDQIKELLKLLTR